MPPLPAGSMGMAPPPPRGMPPIPGGMPPPPPWAQAAPQQPPQQPPQQQQQQPSHQPPQQRPPILQQMGGPPPPFGGPPRPQVSHCTTPNSQHLIHQSHTDRSSFVPVARVLGSSEFLNCQQLSFTFDFCIIKMLVVPGHAFHMAHVLEGCMLSLSCHRQCA